MNPYHLIRNTFLLSCLFFVTGTVTADDTPQIALPGYQAGAGITQKSIHDIMEWALKTYNTPGASVAIIKDGEIFLAEGFGIRNTDTGAPVDNETLFQLASVSKTFTAAAFGAQVDKKNLTWDIAASEVLTDFEMNLPYATKWANGTDFLVHRAGFPAFSGDIFDHLGFSRNDIQHRIRFVEPAYSFRDRPAYSNIGFFLAGEMVAQAGKGSFESVLQDSILTPLGMENTGKAEQLLNQGSNDNIAVSHIPKDNGFKVVPHNLSKVFVAAGGIASNANDLASYIQMLLNEGEFDGKQVLSPETITQIFEPVISSDISFSEFLPIDENSGFDYSPGWGVYHYNGLKILEKGGALDGVRTLIVLVPQEKFGIAILSNMNLTSLPEAVRAGLLQQMFGQPGEVDFQPEIYTQSTQIKELFSSIYQAPLPNKKLSPEQINAFVGQYSSDLYGVWEVARDDKEPSSLVLLCGPAHYRGTVTILDEKTLGIKLPLVLNIMQEASFEISEGQQATSFTFDDQKFRRLPSGQ
ncbi:serine hydrolase [Kiritimatiellota bacterium B12222]|nr:serine hydrolase [Kiritimatiellota bacterium B12222]